VQQQYGTVIAGLCWLTYTFPLASPVVLEQLAKAAKTRARSS
jgi:hypothetical protein